MVGIVVTSLGYVLRGKLLNHMENKYFFLEATILVSTSAMPFRNPAPAGVLISPHRHWRCLYSDFRGSRFPFYHSQPHSANHVILSPLWLFAPWPGEGAKRWDLKHQLVKRWGSKVEPPVSMELMDRIIPEMLKEQTNEQRIHSEPLFSPKNKYFL